MNDDLIRRLRTREPYKSDVQIMVEMLGPEPPIVVLGQGDYPTAVQVADRVTRDMNEAADTIARLRAELAEARNEALREAAKVADDYDDWCKTWGEDRNARVATKAAKEIANAITAMIEDKP